MDILLPEKVEYIITMLMEHGFEAYAVGGCVRDSLLLREPEDWDITTSAEPFEVKQLFRRTIDTGIQHGTVTVMLEKDSYEVTTYRIDGAYEDNRHPKEIAFTKSLSEDLARRDFTINAMAYNKTAGLIDLFGGLSDLTNKIIRCVGRAEERFQEDALRMLRAVRFCAQLDFTIDEETRKAITEKSINLRQISAERIRVELSKLLLSSHPDRLLIAYDTGITAVVLPEFDRMLATKQENKHHIYTVGIHSLKAVEWLAWKEAEILQSLLVQGSSYERWTEAVNATGLSEKKCTLVLRWAALLHDVSKPDTKTIKNGEAHFYCHAVEGAKLVKEIMRRLKFDNETLVIVERLVYCHDMRPDMVRHGCTAAGLRRYVNKVGTDLAELLFYLQEADLYAQNPELAHEKLKLLDRAKEIYREVKKRNECMSLKTLAVNGRDLIQNGHVPGKELGHTLGLLLEHVLEHPQDNEKEVLLDLARKEMIR